MKPIPFIWWRVCLILFHFNSPQPSSAYLSLQSLTSVRNGFSNAVEKPRLGSLLTHTSFTLYTPSRTLLSRGISDQLLSSKQNGKSKTLRLQMSSVDGDGVSELLFGAENETRISSEIFRGASEKHGIVKDLGIHNGTRLLIKNNGNGPVLSYGKSLFIIPESWRDRTEGCSRDYLINWMEMKISSCRSVRISGLPTTLDIDDFIAKLRQEFVLSDRDESVHVVRNNLGVFTGVLVVELSNPSCAERLCGALDKTFVQGRIVKASKHYYLSRRKRTREAKDKMTAAERLSSLFAKIDAVPNDENISNMLIELEEGFSLLRPDTSHRGFLFSRLKSNAQVDRILDDADVSPKTVCKIISDFGRQKDIDKAMAVFMWLERSQYEPNLFHFNAIISACEKSGFWYTALLMLAEIRARNIRPDTITYSTLISACGKGKRSDLALQLFEEMKSNRIPANVITYNALISTCEKTSKLEEAIKIFDEMTAANVKPDIVTYSALISACEKVGDYQQAWKFFEQCSKQGMRPDRIAFNSLISACDKGQRPDLAQKAFDLMRSQGVAMDTITVCSLMSAYATVGNIDKTREVFQGCKDKSPPILLALYHELIRSCHQEGDYETAVSYLEQLEREGVAPIEFTYTLLASVCNQAERPDLADKYTALSREASKSKQGG